MLPSTPTKAARTKAESTANDLCRFCRVNLRLNKRSFENLFKASRREDSKGVVLVELLLNFDIVVRKSPEYSDRVCNSCARKIKNGADILAWIKSVSKEEQPLQDLDCNRQKRQLSTTITPERRPSSKVKTVKSSKQNLFAETHRSNEENEPLAVNIESTDRVKAFDVEDEIRNLMNIDTIDANSKESTVKVFIAYPNGNVVVKENFDKLSTTIIRGIALKKWSTVANSVVKHDELRMELPNVLRREVSYEFKGLSSDSMLKGISPDELCAFSNKVFLHEVSVKCPLWYSVMNGAVGLDLREHDERRNVHINAMTLATSTLARQRNQSLSAYAYRISLVLFHSGISFYDTIRLNHLGICMSPSRIVNLQKQMGSSCDSKLLLWKKDIEEVYSSIKLAEEIVEKQVPEIQEDDMEIDTSVRIDEEYLKSYSTYTKSAYEMFVTLVYQAMKRTNEIAATSSTIQDVLHVLKTRKIPYYK